MWFGISGTGEIIRIDAASAEEVLRIRSRSLPHESPEGVPVGVIAT